MIIHDLTSCAKHYYQMLFTTLPFMVLIYLQWDLQKKRKERSPEFLQPLLTVRQLLAMPRTVKTMIAEQAITCPALPYHDTLLALIFVRLLSTDPV